MRFAARRRVVYVNLKMNRRIISLRKVNNREIDKYEKETN
jgi:uncharacterized DUF497 family protein